MITDTLGNAKRLEKLGLTPQQAEGLSEIVEEAARAAQPDLSNLVTKDFLRAELEKLIARFDGKLSELRVEFGKELRQQMLWFFAMQLAIVSAAFALFKLAG